MTLLATADPDAEVVQEYEGNIDPVEPDNVRVGPVHLARLIPASPDRAEPYDHWYEGTGADDSRVVRSCTGVLVAGYTGMFPNRLDGKPSERP